MSTKERLTPKLIEAIEALLNAIRHEDEKWAEIARAQEVLKELLRPVATSTANAPTSNRETDATSDSPVFVHEHDVDKQKNPGGGGT